MRLLASVVIALFLLGSCQTVQYISDYNQSHDFTPYKTYNFMQWNTANDKYLSGIDKSRIIAAIEKEMSNLGFTKSTTPDVMLNIQVIVEERKGTHAYTTYMGGYYTPFGYGVTTYQEYTYLMGTLIVDMFEEKSKQQVWQGAAIGEVQEGSDKREANIKTVVSRIMKRYPLQPDSK